MPLSRKQIAARLVEAGYIADDELATAVGLMQMLKRALLLEGEAGVGKTAVARALAAVYGTELIRLQCYEGLDQSAALYEWNYQRQLLAIQAHRGGDADDIEDRIFSEKYLLENAYPNFFFHVTTAYDILRHNGVPVGKRDFTG